MATAATRAYRISDAVPLAAFGLTLAPSAFQLPPLPSSAVIAATLAADRSAAAGRAPTARPAVCAAHAAQEAWLDIQQRASVSGTTVTIPGLQGPSSADAFGDTIAGPADPATDGALASGWGVLIDALADGHAPGRDGGTVAASLGPLADHRTPDASPNRHDGLEHPAASTAEEPHAPEIPPRLLRQVLAQGAQGVDDSLGERRSARLPREPLLALDLRRRQAAPGHRGTPPPPPLPPHHTRDVLAMPSGQEGEAPVSWPASNADGDARIPAWQDAAVAGPQKVHLPVKSPPVPLPVPLPPADEPLARGQAWLGFVTGLVLAAALGGGLYVYLTGI